MAGSGDLKKRIKEVLDQDAAATLLDMGVSTHRLVSALIRLSYDRDTLAGRRAVNAVGLIARGIVKTEAFFLRETCRKLLWSLTDESGGIGWSAPEMLGEIVSADPARFKDIIPLVAEAYFVEEDVFRPGVVYALARIAETHPSLVLVQQRIVISALVDKDPLVRIYGLRLVDLLWEEASRSPAWTSEYRRKIQDTVSQLKSDMSDAWIYRGSGFTSLLVKDMAGELEKKLGSFVFKLEIS